MRKKIWSYLEIAGRAARKNNTDKRAYWLGAAAERTDGAIVTACNIPVTSKMPSAHAEWRLSKKLDHGATVYVARVRMLDGKFANAKPCHSCRNALRARRVKKVYYTIAHNEYGILYL